MPIFQVVQVAIYLVTHKWSTRLLGLFDQMLSTFQHLFLAHFRLTSRPLVGQSKGHLLVSKGQSRLPSLSLTTWSPQNKQTLSPVSKSYGKEADVVPDRIKPGQHTGGVVVGERLVVQDPEPKLMRVLHKMIQVLMKSRLVVKNNLSH